MGFWMGVWIGFFGDGFVGGGIGCDRLSYDRLGSRLVASIYRGIDCRVFGEMGIACHLCGGNGIFCRLSGEKAMMV